MARLLGIDPGLRFTGWGVIEVDGNRLRHIADGVIATDSATSVPERLKVLHDALVALMAQHRPDEAAIEETYVNRNGAATLKLGYARGVALLAPALAGIPVTEYGAKSVKLAVVGHRRGGQGAGADDGAPAAAGRARSAGRTPPMRWRWRSAMRIIAPAGWRGAVGRGARDRPAHRTRRGARGRALHHRCERRRLPGAGLHAHAGRTARTAGGRAAAGGDACARGRHPALRLCRCGRTRLVPPADHGAGRRRQGRAFGAVGAVAARPGVARSPPAIAPA